MEREKHENMLMAIARDFNSIDDLIETFLTFLENKTDYFHVMLNDKDVEMLSEKYDGAILKNLLNNNNCGFKAHSREQLLIKSFRKHQINYIMRKQPYIIENEEIKNKYLTSSDELKKIKYMPTTKDMNKEKQENSTKVDSDAHSLNVTQENHISIWNGGKTDKYYWNQALKEINLEMPLNEEIKPNDVNVQITNTNIKIYHCGVLKLEGMFYEEVDKQECVWSIEDKKKIIIYLEKKRENWWPCVIKGDTEIDTKNIESKKNLTDFDEKTQGQIRKFLLEQRMKNEGIPTPEDLRKQNIINNVLSSKGSPFGR
ncbi:CS domain protein, putative [Plasmodium reichenowi]|uniref:Nuclear migration protein nudC n=1 Tax=Plasmodium reichenowi TaxID=5854 RepID=A0A060RWC5_PLARE|nr:CS domain protein, putative [Plasmodium reichenowi]KYN99222.1 CS domain protein, putative [Plasmodium reichenowi]CDO63901.1 CS domain protein, putative [Plasmodium reichenowi]SOV78476.1 CS domain protein, putative [Plasmodium reichenowi]